MSRLRIFDEDDARTPRLSTSDRAEMARELARIEERRNAEKDKIWDNES